MPRESRDAHAPVTRREFDEFRALVEQHHRAFAATLDLDLKQIDAAA